MYCCLDGSRILAGALIVLMADFSPDYVIIDALLIYQYVSAVRNDKRIISLQILYVPDELSLFYETKIAAAKCIRKCQTLIKLVSNSLIFNSL